MALTKSDIEFWSRCEFFTIGTVSAGLISSVVRELATRLLTELSHPPVQHDVWDGAPKEANRAHVNFFKGKQILSNADCPWYERELPKSRIDEIAEEAAGEIESDKSMIQITAKVIKSAILKDREER